ncbi:NAD-dependent succinate-semialdehyde dehydrogenase [Pseudorhodoplanes sp.]|uniref:NAD-dependent succinate-semialdehyde dehydrogenase n=1 Tax=Pseudorhodoplanes sp. TaxID=1934341 RepID=UPI002C16D0A2|nr:NAD-dependent succinate-semialdehyde dehydrogenase [Pseudorhodoplanes sp.]HWV42928.1 NAD-dependent succinate-semialdehyde dehydrogenase [Pseudorhodoplanes sp.]
MYTDLKLYIDGEWLNGAGRKGEEVLNPATGKSLGTLPHASKADLDRALAAADKGFAVWRATTAYDRARIMRKAADLVRERADHIARVMTQEQGKPLVESKGEVLVTADIIDWMAEEGRRAYGRIVPGRGKNIRQLVLQEPVGVVAAFTPWNFPTLTPVRKIAGALAAGCSIIVKASEETPGSCVELVKCFADAGLPKGVLNLVFGVPSDVSEHLIGADSVKKISFTGSVPVGKLLAGLAAKGMKRATMELGGHSPVVVFADADPEKSADTIAAFKYRNAGQVCISPTRFYVQEGVYDRFVKRFTEFANNVKLGDGLEKDTTMGPLANARRLDAMEAIVQDAKSRGGTIVTGGKRRGNQGYFFEPTVITDVPDDSKIMTEEPFGPVAPIVPFKTFDEVVERANSLPFGLASYAFTTNTQTATMIGDALQSGMVGVNSVAISTPETPFGGIKESGYGQEGGIEGLEAYTNRKFISQG